MNFQTFRNQLNELNEFFDYIEKRFKNTGLSDIDRDTLVDYVRDLYKTAFQAASFVQGAETIAPQAPNSLSQKEEEKKAIEIAENTTSFVFEIPTTETVKEAVAPKNVSFEVVATPSTSAAEEEKVVEDTPSTAFTFAMSEEEKVVEDTPSTAFTFAMAAEEEKVVEDTPSTTFTFAMAEEEKVVENTTSTAFTFAMAAEEEKVVEDTTSTAFTFAMAEETATSATDDFEEIAFETTAELVVVTPNEVEETGIAIRNSSELSAQGNVQPQIVLNTIIDDEMFEERTVRFNPEYDDLFYVKTSNELSAKLAEKPIDDLNKAMGFNDKFLYINELFGGNAIKFKTAIDHFNNEARSINDARAYIERELIEAFQWNSALKSNLAKDFIKLLRRRYLKK